MDDGHALTRSRDHHTRATCRTLARREVFGDIVRLTAQNPGRLRVQGRRQRRRRVPQVTPTIFTDTENVVIRRRAPPAT